MALGMMMQLPETDKHTHSKAYWLDALAVFFGGRAAEELVFQDLNTGASNDIQRATDIARRMVTEWGMSDALGPVHYSTKEDHVFLGREIGKGREHSEDTQNKIDQEVRRLLEEQYQLARKILTEKLELLHSLAKAVLERETLDSSEIEKVCSGEELPPVPTSGGTQKGGGPTGATSSEPGGVLPGGVTITA
jgi:cell division protease FtsH